MQESHDKIKTFAPDIMFRLELDIFSIIEPKSWLKIDDLAESIEEISQNMSELFTVHEKIFITVVFHNVFHQSKCMRTLGLNLTH